MDNNLDNLKRLIESIKTISFWGRLFSWRKIRNQLVDASADLQKLISNNDTLKEEMTKYETLANGLSKDLKLSNESVLKKESEIDRLNLQLQDLGNKVSNFTAELSTAKANIKGQEAQIVQLTSDNLLLTEKNTQLHAENKKMTETSGTNSQTITDLAKRKNELDIELAEIKKDLQNIQTELGEVKKQNTQLIKDEELENKDTQIRWLL